MVITLQSLVDKLGHPKGWTCERSACDTLYCTDVFPSVHIVSH